MAAGALACAALGVSFGDSFCAHCANLAKTATQLETGSAQPNAANANAAANAATAGADELLPLSDGTDGAAAVSADDAAANAAIAATASAPPPVAPPQSWFATNGGVFLQMGIALAITLAALAFLAWLERRERSVGGRGAGGDARHGSLYVLAGAGAVLLLAANPLAEGNFSNFLRGEIVSVGIGDLWLVVLALVPAALVLVLFRHEFLWSSADPAFAAAAGRKVFFWNALLAFLLGLVICGSVYIAGPLACLGALLLPAMSAHTLAPNMRGFFLLAPPLGALGAIVGFSVSVATDWPAGMTIIAAHGAILALANLSVAAGSVTARLWQRGA
jgi:zinc transport system permease protein